MNAITLWQPWATLWAVGIKKVETRSWSLGKTKLPSRILIHSSARPIKQMELDAIYIGMPIHSRAVMNALEYPLGCIVGACTLLRSECMTQRLIVNTQPIEKALGLWEVGRWAWYSSDPILLDSPIPCRGYQLFWHPLPEVLDLVKPQLEVQEMSLVHHGVNKPSIR